MSESELSEESIIELLKCSICKELVPRSDVRKHTANHFSKTEHICEHCGKCFAQNFNLVNHKERVHYIFPAESRVIQNFLTPQCQIAKCPKKHLKGKTRASPII